MSTTPAATPAVTAAPVSATALSLMAVLVVVDSLHLIYARALLPYMEPGLSSMYVMAIGALMVGLYAVLQRRLDLRIARQHFWFFATIGLLIGASTVLGYTSVAYLDPGTASILGKMATLFSLAFGVFWLHERLTPRQVGGALLALVGGFVITFQPGDYLRLGALLVIAGTFMYALHTAVVKRYGEGIEFVNFFFFRLLFTTMAMALIAAGRQNLALPNPTALPLLLLTGAVDIVISRSLYYLSLRRLTMSLHTIILTVSPVAAIMWSVLLFDAVPNTQQLLGGAIALIGVAIASLPRGR